MTPEKKKLQTKYYNKFKSKWTSDHSFIKASWKGENHAFCENCRVDFGVAHGGYNDVRRHIGTAKHESNSRAVSQTSKAMLMFETKQKTLSTTNSEVLFTGFLLEHNLPLSLGDHFTKLLPKICPDSDIAKQYACDRAETTHMTMSIGGDAVKQVTRFLGQNGMLFTLATDGSSDEEDTFFPILLSHADQDTGLITTSFIDMPVINCATGENIAGSILNSLSQVGLNIEQCIAFASDNESVMIGKHRGVLGHLQRKNSSVYLVGCPCDLSALAAKKGGKALQGFDPEDFIIDIYYHFEKSAKRKEQLKEMLEFCDVAVRKVLKHDSTRWLSLHKCLDRTLALWEGLRSYFLTHYDDDNDDQDENDSPKGPGPHQRKRKANISIQKGTAREKRLVQAFKEPTSKLYVEFLVAVLPHFDSFNVLMQTEAPMIHLLYPSMLKLFRALMSCVICPEHMLDTDILKVDFNNPQIQKADNELFIGFNAMEFIEKGGIEGTNGVNKFRNEVRSFYLNSLNYMVQKFPFNDPVIKHASVIDPLCRGKVSMSHLFELVKVVPACVLSCSKDALCREFCTYQSDTDLPNFKYGDRVDEFWLAVGKMKDDATAQPKYGILSSFAMNILLIPHSNAKCESLFSMVKKITTEQRSQLGNSKEGRAKSSVYEDVHGIRNTLCGILAAKINIFKDTHCYSWKPDDKLLANAKSATYNALKIEYD